MVNWRSTIYGGIGGAFVPIFSLSQDLISKKPFDANIGWFLGLFLLFALGAILANASSEKIPLKALAIGISLPATINGYLQQNIAEAAKLAQSSPHPTELHGFLDLVIARAYAQAGTGGSLIATVSPDLPTYQIVFYGPAGAIGSPVTVANGAATIAIPAGASSLAVHGPEGWSLPLAVPPLPAGESVRLSVDRRSTFSRGFRRSFGASDAPYELELR